MTHGALHRVLSHEPICFRTYYALNVVGQKIFEIHTKHRFFFASCRFILAPSLSLPAFGRSVLNLCLAHCNNFHPPENLCQFNAATIDSRLNRAFGNLQQIHYLLVTKLFNISQYHARP